MFSVISLVKLSMLVDGVADLVVMVDAGLDIIDAAAVTLSSRCVF